MGGLVLLRRAGEARGVARELAERDVTNVAALLQLGDVFGDGIFERDLALLHRLRQQRRQEHLGDGREVEQRVRGDRLLARDVGHAVVEEQGAALDMDRDRHAAGGNQHRLHVLADEPLHLGVVGARGGGRGHARGGEHCRRHCRHHPHFSLPSGLGRMALPLNAAWTGLLGL